MSFLHKILIFIIIKAKLESGPPLNIYFKAYIALFRSGGLCRDKLVGGACGASPKPMPVTGDQLCA